MRGKRAIKTTILSLLLGFFVVFLAIFIYLKVNSQDRLIKYVPEDAYFYAHFNFDPYTLQGYRLKRAIENKPQLSKFLNNSSDTIKNVLDIVNIDFNKEITSNISAQISLALLENESKTFEALLIMEVKEPKKVIKLMEKMKKGQPLLFYVTMGLTTELDYFFIKPKTVAIGSRDTLKKVKSLERGQALTLRENLKEDSLAQNFFYLFLKPEAFSEYTSESIVQNFIKGFNNQIENSDLDKILLTFSLESEEDLFFELTGTGENISKEKSELNHLNIQRFLDMVPADSSFILLSKNFLELVGNHDLYLGQDSLSLKEKFENIEKVLSSQSFSELEKTKAALALNKNESEKFSIIFDSLKPEGQKELENLIKNLMAIRFPKETEKELPDGTEIIELIPDPTLFEPQTIWFPEGQKILAYKRDDLDYFLSISDNEIIFSNVLPITSSDKKSNFDFCLPGYAREATLFSAGHFEVEDQNFYNQFLTLFETVSLSANSRLGETSLRGCTRLK